MTAVHATVNTNHTAKHVAPKVRRHHLPNRTSFQHVRAAVLSPFVQREAKAIKATAVKAPASRVTETGQALFSVDSAGIADRNLIARGRDGFATFAVASGSAISDAFPSHWLIEWFETEEQRRNRINAQAVATVMQLLGALAKR